MNIRNKIQNIMAINDASPAFFVVGIKHNKYVHIHPIMIVAILILTSSVASESMIFDST